MGQEVVVVGSFLVSLLLVPRDKSKGNGQVFIPWGQRRVWAQPAAAGLPSGDNLGRARNTQLRQDARQFSPSGEQQQNESKDCRALAWALFPAGREPPPSSQRREPEPGGEQAGRSSSSVVFLPLVQGESHSIPAKSTQQGPGNARRHLDCVRTYKCSELGCENDKHNMKRVCAAWM